MIRQDIASKLSKTAARRARRAEKVAENASLAGERVLSRPKRKKSWKALVRLADKAFSGFIRRRDPFSIFSGKPTECCFHVVTRDKYSVRWDPGNAVGATHAENFEMEFNPHKFTQVLIEKKGLAWYEALVKRSNVIVKRSWADMEAIIAKFNGEEANA